MVIGMISISQGQVFAATDTATGLEYTISGEEATITGFTAPTGFSGALTIPATLGGSPVTSIGESAFSNCTLLTSVTIPSSVTTIGNTVFTGCSALTDIIIPNGVTTIGSEVFVGCEELTSISVPSSVTSIGLMAFSGCWQMTSITVDPANMTYKSIDGMLYSKDETVFISCPGGKTGSVTIPSSVSEIKELAFVYCDQLSSITIPSSVEVIGNYAFEYTAFTSVIVEEANTVYKTINDILYTKDGTELIYCAGGKTGDVTIPDGVEYIYPNAFEFCRQLTGVTLPSSVVIIGQGAFYNCESLVSVNIPSGVTSLDRSVFMWCSSLTDITIPSNVTSIEDSAFWGCSSLTRVNIPSSVTSIGQGAFWGCNNLSKAYFYGNAPVLDMEDHGVFSECAIDFTIHYLRGKTGYTNPWNGYPTAPFGVSYQTHIQDFGWQEYKSNGAASGTSGQSKRLEAIRIKLEGVSGGIEYRTHVQDIGWQGWVANDALSGTSAQSKRLEAIQIRLTGEAADLYDVYYRVHAQDTGWMDWAKNGASAGTAAYSRRLEAIEIKIVAKGSAAPGATARPFIQNTEPIPPTNGTVSYKTHVQDVIMSVTALFPVRAQDRCDSKAFRLSLEMSQVV